MELKSVNLLFRELMLNDFRSLNSDGKTKIKKRDIEYAVLGLLADDKIKFARMNGGFFLIPRE